MKGFIKKIFNNLHIKLMCVIISFLVFLFISEVLADKRTVYLPSIIRMPSSYVITSPLPEKVEVTISGDDRIIFLINPAKISAVVDLTKAKEGSGDYPVVITYPREDLYTKVRYDVKPRFVHLEIKKSDTKHSILRDNKTVLV